MELWCRAPALWLLRTGILIAIGIAAVRLVLPEGLVVAFFTWVGGMAGAWMSQRGRVGRWHPRDGD